MKDTDAIQRLKQRNINYLQKKGVSDRYSRETDEIISSFVDTHNKCVKRGKSLENIKMFAEMLVRDPGFADVFATAIIEEIELLFHKENEK